MNSENSMARFTDRDKLDIKTLLEKIDGDGNGNKGLIRRMDAMENTMRYLRKQSWVIISMQLALFVTLLAAILVK